MEFREYLIASNEMEEQIKEYIIKNASDNLITNCMSSEKNISDAIEYLKKEAKKIAKKNFAFMTDAQGFSILMHYLEENEIEKIKTKDSSTKVSTSDDEDVEEDENVIAKHKDTKPLKNKKQDKPNAPSLFDFV